MDQTSFFSHNPVKTTKLPHNSFMENQKTQNTAPEIPPGAAVKSHLIMERSGERGTT